jgi:hypothetical protein
LGEGFTGDRHLWFEMAVSGKRSVLPITHGPSRELPRVHFNRWMSASHKRMNSSVCICCGESMHEDRNPLSRNPNICASCSSIADGIEDSTPFENAGLGCGQETAPTGIEALAWDRRGT